MNVTIYFSISKYKRSKEIASTIDGDCFELKPLGRIFKSIPAQMFNYGYRTVFNRPVNFQIDTIDFSKYDTVTIISPIWAGRVSQYMRKYLESKPFMDKNVVVIGSCEGGEGDYFESVKSHLDPSNKVIEEVLYIKGEKQ